MYDRGAEMYMEGYIDGADAVFFVLSEYLPEDIINHVKEKRLEYYKLWKDDLKKDEKDWEACDSFLERGRNDTR